MTAPARMILTRSGVITVDGAAHPEHGQVLAVESDRLRASWRWGAPPSPTRAVLFWTDFLAENANVSGLLTSNSGGGVVAVTGEAAHPGIVEVTSSGASSWAFMGSGASAILFGSGEWSCRAIVRIPTLSDGTNTFEVFVGFIDPASGSGITDGAYVYYSHGTNSGRWEYRTVSNSVQSTADSGVTVAANTWYYVEVEVGADGTQATFRINGAAQQSIASNVPSGSGRNTGFGVYKRQSAGSSFRGIQVDALLVEASYTAARV